ncbi:CPBP family intramembrane metalloprotease [Herbaspirillum sp. AP02]|uniref:CPBP family intramembrane glutamic endopeptidase n=1 Tax=unclassified Herbaspirillum TaxID=2624150 RepID=UPI0015D9F0B5|nr:MULTISPECIES: CPBP family intramembrane glutamic endopeptidase [unclassified Herbaspirillum]MBG7622276.1 CPBP family intramembrane metalloprotease [Herbaspirillum sp. AP02]NZD70208.1 CPBP family intramembrane metalloprotease [Herbaspirillum sp. AP21]
MSALSLSSLPSLSAALLLMLAICTVWLPALPLRGPMRLPPWLLLLVLAVAVALLNGQVNVVGVVGLLLLGVSAWRAGCTHHAQHAWQTDIWLAPVIVLSLLLAMHRWPGFLNPLVLPRQAITPGALPFMLYANLDKGAAGLLLLALLAPRCHARKQWQTTLRRALLPGLLTIVVVMLSGWLLGMVRPEAKWPPFAATFLAINLLLTVVAEEAFFRGLIQQRLQLVLHTLRGGQLLAVVVSAVLFGAAHLGGGMVYAALASVAGLGYAVVFQRSGRIEAAIAVHFALNAVHFLGFTYPALA